MAAEELTLRDATREFVSLIWIWLRDPYPLVVWIYKHVGLPDD